MKSARVSEAELRRQFRAARENDALDRKVGKRALSARYDPVSRRVLLELTNGYLFGFPVSAIPALARVSDPDLAKVTASPGGMGLHWDELDVDLSVPGLLMSSIGRSWKVRELARVAGQSKSPAKAAAARRNGKKGGRPRSSARR